MMTKLPTELLYVVHSNDNLERYLESLLERKDFTPRSWEYDGEEGNPFLEPDAVLGRWRERLNTLENGSEFEKNVFQFDTAQLSKWGPQGGHAPIGELLPSIILPSFKEDQSVPAGFKSQSWKEAKRRVVRWLKRNGCFNLSPTAYERVVDDMRARDTLESNSGFPSFARRSKPEVKAQAIADAYSGKWKQYPAITLFRTYNGKTRLVWIFPMAANIVEGSFFQPLQSILMRSDAASDFFCPWKGFEAVRHWVTRMYDAEWDEDVPWHLALLASDFSSTDAHFQWSTTVEVYDVLKECFKKEHHYALFESLHYMHSIPLLIGPDNMLTGMHGVSSGSNWTNFVETIFDRILAEFVQIETNDEERAQFVDGAINTADTIDRAALVPNPRHVRITPGYAIGDDMTWVLESAQENGRVTREDCEAAAALLEAYGDLVGQVINKEKVTAYPDKIKSLQRLFQREYKREDGELRAVYSTIRALKSSIYPERYHSPSTWNSDMFCARQFMILENCVDHPLFKEFVSFICKGNRHLIPFAKQTASELDRIHREAKLIPGLTSTYNQEKRDESLSEFASIRVARSLG